MASNPASRVAPTLAFAIPYTGTTPVDANPALTLRSDTSGRRQGTGGMRKGLVKPRR